MSETSSLWTSHLRTQVGQQTRGVNTEGSGRKGGRGAVVRSLPEPRDWTPVSCVSAEDPHSARPVGG